MVEIVTQGRHQTVYQRHQDSNLIWLRCQSATYSIFGRRTSISAYVKGLSLHKEGLVFRTPQPKLDFNSDDHLEGSKLSQAESSDVELLRFRGEVGRMDTSTVF